VGDTGLESLLEFLNTVDVEAGEEELADDAAWAAWLEAQGLGEPTVHDATDARAVRDALRAAADGDASLGHVLEIVPLRVRLMPDGSPVVDAADPLGRLLATAVALGTEGRWSRVKLCDAHTCRYAFYDASRNRSGRWCSMAVCGNREKTRAFRERHRAHG
jgi:predicted RNA-binding Zn ribbon-like protein